MLNFILNIIGAILNAASLLLLTGAALKNESAVQQRIERISHLSSLSSSSCGHG